MSKKEYKRQHGEIVQMYYDGIIDRFEAIKLIIQLRILKDLPTETVEAVLP